MDNFEYNLKKAKHVLSRHKIKSKGIITVTELDIADLLTNSTKCAICGKYFYHEEDKTIDHIIPVCKNGELSMKNIQVLCLSCNSRKGVLEDCK